MLVGHAERVQTMMSSTTSISREHFTWPLPLQAMSPDQQINFPHVWCRCFSNCCFLLGLCCSFLCERDLQEGNLNFLKHFGTSRCQPHGFSQSYTLGPVFLEQISEAGVYDIEHYPLPPLRELSAWCSPSLLCSWAGGGLFW